VTLRGALAVLAALPTAVTAQSRALNPHVALTLVSERTALEPGRPLRLAIHMAVEAGWHVYWRNPGQSGFATAIRWTLPPGFTVEPLEWPVPEVLDVAGIRTHVHHGDLALATGLRVPGRQTASPLQIVADVSYGVCKDACYPGAAHLILDLPWGAGTQDSRWAAMERLIESRRPRSPSPFRLQARLRDTTVILTVRAPVGGTLPGQITFFPSDRNVIRAAITVRVPRGAGSVAMRLPLHASPAGPIRGVLAVGEPAAGAPLGYEVSITPAP
jgi:thiol:disulfide interchange protein DsbD